uniref:28s ribosomal protein s36 mitochondrial n=1 Tax=Corethrella appendiculata TaxID=1370023 RepID=U5ESB8_9DIPT
MVLLKQTLNVAKRIPLIKFRKGGNLTTGASSSHLTAAAGSSSGAKAVSGPAIEEWQLPQRYRRRPIDEAECEFINRGGPA